MKKTFRFRRAGCQSQSPPERAGLASLRMLRLLETGFAPHPVECSGAVLRCANMARFGMAPIRLADERQEFDT